jgi:hypothetical protein
MKFKKKNNLAIILIIVAVGFSQESPAGVKSSHLGFQTLLMAAHGERFDLLLGRRTYNIWSGFWPKTPSSPIANGLNAATKFIATHCPESLEWGPFEGVGPDIVEGIRRIKSQDAPDLILSDSSTLTSTPSGIILSTYKVAGPLKTG